MKQLAPIGDALMGSNLWLSIGASTMTSASFFCLTGHWTWNKLDTWVFFATLSLYNWHRVLGFRKQGLQAVANAWANAHPKTIFSLALIASLCAALWYASLPVQVQLSLLIPVALGLSYSFPILPKQKRLRDVPRLKILILASVWAWVVVGLPQIYASIPFSALSSAVYLEKWLLFFAIAIGFDIRDAPFDLAQGIQTLPSKYGAKQAKILAIGALILSMAICTGLYSWHIYSLAVLAACIISSGSTGVLLLYASPQRSAYFFNLLLDGILILQPLGIWVFSTIDRFG